MTTLLTPVRHALSMLPSKIGYIKNWNMFVGFLSTGWLGFNCDDGFEFWAVLCVIDRVLFEASAFATWLVGRGRTRAACSARGAPLPRPGDTASVKAWSEGTLSIYSMSMPCYVRFILDYCRKPITLNYFCIYRLKSWQSISSSILIVKLKTKNCEVSKQKTSFYYDLSFSKFPENLGT